MIDDMRRLLQIAFAAWLALALSAAQVWAFPSDSGSYTPASSEAAETSGYTKDTERSDALTAYFKNHRLPLVGAQVLNDPSSGRRVVVLYGFVATDFGKSDATAKARAFLNDPSLVVENRVMIDPEIARQRTSSPHQEDANSGESSASSGAASEPDSTEADNGSGSMGGPDSYLEHQSPQAQLQQYQNQQNPMAGGGMANGTGGMLSMGGSMVPLIALLGLLSGGSGSGLSSSPLGMPNSFGGGPSPYQNPYGGGSPYSYPPGAFPPGPYGSPYGAPPGSFSPYP
jgi:hypothetical protein